MACYGAVMILPAWLLVLLAIGATARLTRLVNEDAITQPIRSWFFRRDPAAEDMEPEEIGRWAYFITCPWCVSIWVGALVAYLAVWWGDNRVIVTGLLALTCSVVTGLVAGLVDR
jgi:hypothetical protein